MISGDSTGGEQWGPPPGMPLPIDHPEKVDFAELHSANMASPQKYRLPAPAPQICILELGAPRSHKPPRQL
jgi:hypothetical protein